jgi:hypothetical protein
LQSTTCSTSSGIDTPVLFPLREIFRAMSSPFLELACAYIVHTLGGIAPILRRVKDPRPIAASS